MDSADSNLYSAGYNVDDAEACGGAISTAFRELRRLTGEEVRCVRWNDNYIAAAFTLKVDLPSLGTVDDIDIRAREPVLMVFNKRDYPEVAPMVRSDRKDFPTDRLPHLNPVAPGQPPSMCLYRGNINDWFVEHSLDDLLVLARDWFRDAAAGRLIPPGDEFEPTRIVDPWGTFIFQPLQFQEWIEQGWKSTDGKAGYGFLLMRRLSKDPRTDKQLERTTLKGGIFFPKDEDALQVALDVWKTNNELQQNSQDLFWVGILCWTSRDSAVPEYFGQLPATMDSLITFCGRYDVPLEQALERYINQYLLLFNSVPLIVGINRQRKLIGRNLQVEPLNFLIDARDPEIITKNRIDGSAQVLSMSHSSPLTPSAAKNISGIDEAVETGRILLFGCGALGSKLALHYARSGQTALTLVDERVLLPHNLVRHALLGDAVGHNKAEKIKTAIDAIYDTPPAADSACIAYQGSALDWIKGEKQAEVAGHSLLIDATASASVFEAIIRAPLPPDTRIVRCGIGAEGKIGMLLIEGPQRNPRLDDVLAMVYDLAIDNEALQRWLQNERAETREGRLQRFTEIALGVGCSSDTMPLPDDLISWHAATFSMRLRRRFDDPSSGLLTLSYVDDQDEHGIHTQSVPVPPVTTLRPSGDRGWQIRLHSQAAASLYASLRRESPNETGGILIGLIHPGRRIIYITRVFGAPPDSEGTAARFKRGTLHLPEEVDDIQNASGGLLGYVGEWHTHPLGGRQPSATDRATMADIRRHLEPAGLPTLMLIVTPRHIDAHISVPNHLL